MISLLLLALACTIVGCRAQRDVSIPAVQGRAHLSPLLGEQVRLKGIVTAAGAGWIYVQGSPDSDETTSDGLIVRIAGTRFARGDEVRLSGVVSELVPGGTNTANLSTTTLEAFDAEILARNRPLPRSTVLGRDGRLPPHQVISPDELPVNLRVQREVQQNRYDPSEDAIDFFESLEGMLVTVRRPVAVSATQTFSQDQSEVVTLPDAGAGMPAKRRTRRGGILLQPNQSELGGPNPERIQIQFDRTFLSGGVPLVRVGDTLGDVTGIMRYSFGNYEVAAIGRLAVTPGSHPPETGTLWAAPNALTVASYNVLNLSPTAPDSAQRRLLAMQIVKSLGSPDILALQEIQDDSGEEDDGTTSARETLAALRTEIVSARGPRYASFDIAPVDGRPGGVPGGNIRNAFLYNPERVRLVSYRSLGPAILAAAGARDSLAFEEARDPLEGVFEFRGRSLRVVNNHLTSRFGSTPVFGSVQPFVQAGEGERAAQVRALHAYAAHVLAADPGARLIVLGDMNTFEFSPELAHVLPGSPPALHQLLFRVSEDERYSFNYEGNSQTLDHVFVSKALQSRAELDIVHLNVDFPALPGLTPSDHDPVVARFVP
ncbi:MAG TPA: endonuclease/exonuclease/phosphatase family protein [Gemmatimonadales bacterium]|nr:endonuclease/exonuclease/phosphatase family protein [Gemmatimonadales bacterium]